MAVLEGVPHNTECNIILLILCRAAPEDIPHTTITPEGVSRKTECNITLLMLWRAAPEDIPDTHKEVPKWAAPEGAPHKTECNIILLILWRSAPEDIPCPLITRSQGGSPGSLKYCNIILII